MRRRANSRRVHLVDATIGAHAWAERYDRTIEHVFAVQDEIANAIAVAISPVVGDVEQHRIRRKAPRSISAWEQYQRGLWDLAQNTLEGNERARRFFRQAASMDPGLASPFIGLAFAHASDTLFHGLRPLQEAARLIEGEARQAIAIDPKDAEAFTALSVAFAFSGNLDGTLASTERALALNRNSAFAHFMRGAGLLYSGRHTEGRAEISMSLRLNPRDPGSPYAMGVLAAACYFERDYGAAVETARRGLDDHPTYFPTCRWLVAALGQLGRREEAEAALHDWLERAPAVFNVTVCNRPPYVSVADHEHMLEGLRKAGWRG